MSDSIHINTLKKSGFVNIGRILSSAEVDELVALCDSLYEEVSRPSSSTDKVHPDYINHSGCEGVARLPQINKRVAHLLDKIVSSGEVRELLTAALGPDYKIWAINSRISLPGDKGLYLHQDAFAQLNLGMLLSDHTSTQGVTNLIPGSHLIAKSMKRWGVEFPPMLFRFIKFLLTPLSGKKGDVFAFLNRTWHGRYPNNSNTSNHILMLGFFPAGAKFSYVEQNVWSDEFLASMRGTELGRLIDPSIGMEKLDDGYYRVLKSSNNKSSDAPYALAIESGDLQEPWLGNVKLASTVLILRVVMFVWRLLSRVYRVFVPRKT